MRVNHDIKEEAERIIAYHKYGGAYNMSSEISHPRWFAIMSAIGSCSMYREIRKIADYIIR